MFVTVQLLHNFTKHLLYAVPDHLQKQCGLNKFVRVPLQNRHVYGLIKAIHEEVPQSTFKIKSIEDIISFPEDPQFLLFINKIAAYYCLEPGILLQRIVQFLHKKQPIVPPSFSTIDHNHHHINLTHEQHQIVQDICPAIVHKRYMPCVLHGVTGSGKTEVFFSLMQAALANGKTILYILPEVSLAARFTKIFKDRLQKYAPVIGFHSATGAHEKKNLWQLLFKKHACVIIGVHLPIFLPIYNLGLIIIDEEHDTGYQEKKHPKINTKEVALIRAQQYNVPIILGSATPAFTTLYNVENKGWRIFKLAKRYAGNNPTVQIISLKTHKKRKEFWLTRELSAAIHERLNNNEQVMLFLNRRGHSFFVQCKSCSYIFECPSCSVSLTYHQQDRLICHYCNFQRKLIETCPDCKQENSFLKKGVGTQQLVNILQKNFPHARIARADLDTTVQQKKWSGILDEMHAGNIDILVGTQTITKGYDFKKLTLVGIIWADLSLHVPLYNSSETTLQQLIQVAGRAGRHSQHSQVIIQTLSEHPIFNYVTEQAYEEFYHKEIKGRGICNYPPFSRLAEIEIQHKNEKILHEEANTAGNKIRTYVKNNNLHLDILGPASPVVNKIKKVFYKKIYLKSQSIKQINQLYLMLKQSKLVSTIFLRHNPLN